MISAALSRLLPRYLKSLVLQCMTAQCEITSVGLMQNNRISSFSNLIMQSCLTVLLMQGSMLLSYLLQRQYRNCFLEMKVEELYVPWTYRITEYK